MQVDHDDDLESSDMVPTRIASSPTLISAATREPDAKTARNTAERFAASPDKHSSAPISSSCVGSGGATTGFDVLMPAVSLATATQLTAERQPRSTSRSPRPAPNSLPPRAASRAPAVEVGRMNHSARRAQAGSPREAQQNPTRS